MSDETDDAPKGRICNGCSRYLVAGRTSCVCGKPHPRFVQVVVTRQFGIDQLLALDDAGQIWQRDYLTSEGKYVWSECSLEKAE